ncbi:MAG: ParB/RepB/Spo0J family partition protein [Chitinispirillaceae bacterium]
MLATKTYEYLEFDRIGVHPSIGNHRRVSPSKVAHLENDILRNGLLEPLVVWERSPGEYFLVGGFHRAEAIGEIRKKNPGYFDRVDVRVVAGDPDEIKALNLKLNADRLDTKITDYFETVVYLNNVNWSPERIAEFLDKSISWIEEIIKYAPMVNSEMHTKLETGELSWSRVKEIIQRTLQAPPGNEKAVMEEELSKKQSRAVKPLTFRSVLGHFNKVKKNDPEVTYTLGLDELTSLVRVLQGKTYGDDDLETVESLFPELMKKEKTPRGN